MGIGDLTNKAKEALNSDRAEKLTDQGLDRAAAGADKLTGGKFSDRIQRGRDAVDEKIGNDGAGGGDSAGGRPADRR